MSNTITIKIADFGAIFNAAYAEGNAKPEQYYPMSAKIAAKVKFGAIKVDGNWYAVRNGEIDRTLGYQHSTAAVNNAIVGLNITVKPGYAHITK